MSNIFWGDKGNPGNIPKLIRIHDGSLQQAYQGKIKKIIKNYRKGTQIYVCKNNDSESLRNYQQCTSGKLSRALPKNYQQYTSEELTMVLSKNSIESILLK